MPAAPAGAAVCGAAAGCGATAAPGEDTSAGTSPDGAAEAEPKSAVEGVAGAGAVSEVGSDVCGASLPQADQVRARMSSVEKVLLVMNKCLK